MPDKPTPVALLTAAGREKIAAKLKLLVRGDELFDEARNTVVTDEDALASLNEVPEKLLDEAEGLFDMIITNLNRMRPESISMYIRSLDGTWFDLKNLREKAGRPKPKA